MLSRMADTRVSAAVSHWAPRFLANGIDYNDFARVTSAISTWDTWCEQWCLAGAVHEQLGRAALADGRDRSAGAHLSQAAVYYHFAKFMFVDDIDQMRAAHLLAVRSATDALPFLDPPGERVGIWGVSLGGYYAARVASGDDRVRACIALSGPYCLGDVWDQLPELSRAAFTVRSKSGSHEEARQRAGELTMAGRADRITAPMLIVAGKRDRIFPWTD